MKRILKTILAPGGYGAGLLLLRVAAGGMMATHGWAKLTGFNELSQTFMDPVGLGPELSLALIIFAEFFCSLAVIAGLLTRLAAIPLIIGMTVAAFVAHAPVTLSGSELPLLYLVIFIVILIAGAGRYSADAAIHKRFLSQAQ